MALAFLRRDREPITEPEVELPAPPRANPFTEAQDRWGELREYAERAMEVSRRVAAENRQLIADNTALGREVDRLLAMTLELQRDNRVIRAYGTAVRARVSVLRELAETIEREALHSAHEASAEPPPADDEPQLQEVVEGIKRHTPDHLPPNAL